MSLLTNIASVAFTSRYDVDKVIVKKSGSISVPQAATISDSVLVTIPHGLGYAPLCLGQFSESSDFSTAYEFGNPPYAYSATFAQWLPRIDGIVESDATNIYITLINFDTTRTLYYRTIGLIPSGVTSSPYMDVSDRNDTLFNAQDNYLKIFMDSKVSNAFDGANDQTFSILHGLGYRPMVFVFSEEGGKIRRAGAENQAGVTGIFSRVTVDTANLVINADVTFATTLTYHYRIYLDN